MTRTSYTTFLIQYSDAKGVAYFQANTAFQQILTFLWTIPSRLSAAGSFLAHPYSSKKLICPASTFLDACFCPCSDGAVVRSRRIVPGVFALVTESGAKAVSVCCPIWNGDLTTYTVKLGQQEETGLSQDHYSDSFFSEETGCLALFELSQTHALPAEAVNLTAAKNAVFQAFPEYAVHHNRRKATGLKDSAGVLLQLAGAEVVPAGQEENLLTWMPSVGTEYLVV